MEEQIVTENKTKTKKHFSFIHRIPYIIIAYIFGMQVFGTIAWVANYGIENAFVSTIHLLSVMLIGVAFIAALVRIFLNVKIVNIIIDVFFIIGSILLIIGGSQADDLSGLYGLFFGGLLFITGIISLIIQLKRTN